MVRLRLEQIRYSHRTETALTGEQSILTIEKSDRKDSALISCIASNDYGEDTLNVQVTVQDIPDAPQNLEIHDVASRSVRLTWQKPFDGNFPITRYTIMWRQIDGKTAGGPLHVPGSETTLIIRGLRPKTRYFFRVKCENTLGESQFGAEVAVTTLEEPPSSPPQSVKASPISSKTVNVTWQGLGSNPGEDMVVCKCIVPLRQGGTLNSRRAASPLVWLVEERWEAPDQPPLNWGGTQQKHTVTYMVAKANDRRQFLS
ncbi:down syndrome cell adhesion molecule homolog [Trichonephila clavipes]|nr:down syndrome cell adhesion molecule homolog [Trichonephila clavipes]